MNILITAPSLETKNNVSGISTVVNNIVTNSSFTFKHFQLGSTDNKQSTFKWLINQILSLFKIFGSLKGVDVVHVNTALNSLSIFRDSCYILISRVCNKKILLHVHGGKYLIADCKNPLIKFTINQMIRLSDYVLVLSPIEENLMKQKFKVNKISFLVNSISPEKSKNRRSVPLEIRPLAITFLGRIHDSKGIDDIIPAMKKLNEDGVDFLFSVYGSGPEKDYFTDSLEKGIGDKFIYKGIVSGDAKWDALAKSDVFLLPSRYGEGLPMAMLEAMAMGNVVIVSNDASITYAVSNGENGLIVEKNNYIDIVDKIKMLVNNNVLRIKLSNNAVETIYKKFNLNDYIENLEKIYAELGYKVK